MKNILTKLLYASIVIGVYLVPVLNSLAQTNKVINYSTEEKRSMELMRKDGASDAGIDQWIMQRRLMPASKKNTKTPGKQSDKPIAIHANACGDMGAENGWSNWQGRAGTISATGALNWGAWSSPPPASNNNTAFVITTGGANDACNPSPGNPALPVVAPGFGNASIRLGVRVTPHAFCEQISFPLIVAAKDTNFIYTYAIILDNPADGNHVGIMAPHAEIYILDAQGDTVPCSHQLYFGSNDNTLPAGFYDTDCNNAYSNAYKPWTIVGVNLNRYIGQTLNVVVSNYDCALGGHFCHSYWDFACPPITGSDPPYCVGTQVTLTAPPSDPGNPYTYQWYVNGAPYGTPIATSISITPIPQVGDTFSLHVHQPSGCDFWIPYAPQPSTIKADFTDQGNCGKMTFQDMSAVIPVSTTNTVVAWNWSFPGGNPSGSTSQNPGTITYPPGTYTATLISTSSAGCEDTIQHVFSVGGFPTAAFTPTSPCLGGTTTLVDGSVAPTGDPIASWNWLMPGGTPSTASSTTASSTHNTSTLYPTGGTHIVTLIVTSLTGCIDTITQQVLLYNPPIADFIQPDSGCSPVIAGFNDISKPVDGSIASWQWSFPGGLPATSTVQNPTGIHYNIPGSYSVSLLVTTSYGCKDTIKLPMIKVYPWPMSEFCVAPTIAPTTAPLFNFCDMWSSDVVQWSWDFGDGSALDMVNTDPVHSYSATANSNDFYKYNICIRVQNQYGCWDTTCHAVELIPEFTFYIPNTFTPNGDYMNEMFYGKCRGVKEYDIWLFDRWGNQIWDCHKDDKNTNWDSNDTNPRQEGLSSFCKWDGVIVKGGMDMGGNSRQLAQEDVYVWKVKLLDIFDKHHTYVGHVNIVR